MASSSQRTDDNLNDCLAENLKLQLWARGTFDFDVNHYSVEPISYVREEFLAHRSSRNCDMNGYCRIRGGSDDPIGYDEHIALKIKELGATFGPEFLEAIELNNIDHAEDCKRSCEIYYCADASKPLIPFDELLGKTMIKSYSMGPVPPEDFAESFG